MASPRLARRPAAPDVDSRCRRIGGAARERVSRVARRLLEQQSGQRARGQPQRQSSEQPERQQRLSGVVRCPHPPSVLQIPTGPADHGWSDAVEGWWMARARPVRTLWPPFGRGVGRISKRGAARACREAGLAAPHPCSRAAWRSQPPSRRPISATMRLTCSYWPSESQRQWWARRRYIRSVFSAASASSRAA